MVTQPKYKTLFLDLFGVLLGIDQSSIVHYVSQKIDIPYLQIKDLIMGELFMKLQRGEIDFKQYYQDLQSAIPRGQNLDYTSFHQKWMSSEIDELPLVGMLPQLQDKLDVYIISNTTNRHIESLSNSFPFMSSIQNIFTSESAGAHKPNPIIFNYALSLTDSDSTHSIFIDDMASNVFAAKQLGFTSIRYKDYETLMTQLSKIL